ncbi:MAG: hypothetical protein ACP5OO_05410 [Chloroflexia bacterium]
MEPYRERRQEEQKKREEAARKYLARKMPDEKTRFFRKWRNTLAWLSPFFVALLILCLLVSLLLGGPQSFLGQWWMRPPRYPEAQELDYRVGEICSMPAPAVYCYEWWYRTPDSLEQVRSYYENLEWWGHAKISFVWKRSHRYGPAWTADSCTAIISTVSCYQITLLPEDAGTTLYILEAGAMGGDPLK